MIQLQGISKQYGSKVLLEGSDAFIGARSRVALIGANGAGKSTLIRIILGQEESDSGQVVRSRNIRFGHLAQEVPRYQSGTVLSEVMKLDPRIHELQQRKHVLEESFSEGKEDPKAFDEYGEILTELERFDESRVLARAKEILMGMGFREKDFSRPLTEFSGGWLMRVAFSRVLLSEPDLLLLDEPTNHLDLESLIWLEGFLKNYPGAILVISHDTAFLNSLVDEVLEIDQRKIYQYRGNLAACSTQKAERLMHLKAQYENQQTKIEHLQEFIDKNRAKASKATQAQSRIKQIERMEKIELPEDRSTIRFKFPPAPPSGKEVISLKGVDMHFTDKKIFDDLNWTLQRGTRLAITGVNGAGKTTLLRLLSGTLDPHGGEVKLGHGVQVGYYAQHQSETLDFSKTILDELQDTAPHLPVSQVRGIAGAFLFSGDAVEKKCSVLSGGEKARVALAKLLLAPSNFLILDEPTNHLDKDSREVLLEALKNYAGTVCLVSHDRDFIGPLVTSVLEVKPGATPQQPSEAIQLLGSYDDYLRKKLEEVAAQKGDRNLAPKAQKASKNTSTPLPPTPSTEEKPRRDDNRERRIKEKKQAKIEQDILTLEKEKQEIDLAFIQQSGSFTPGESQRLTKRRGELDRALAEKEKEWEETFVE